MTAVSRWNWRRTRASLTGARRPIIGAFSPASPKPATHQVSTAPFLLTLARPHQTSRAKPRPASLPLKRPRPRRNRSLVQSPSARRLRLTTGVADSRHRALTPPQPPAESSPWCLLQDHHTQSIRPPREHQCPPPPTAGLLFRPRLQRMRFGQRCNPRKCFVHRIFHQCLHAEQPGLAPDVLGRLAAECHLAQH
jgi:hypothetical protein